MRAQLTEVETKLEQSDLHSELSESAKAEATESIAQLNAMCREQAATIGQLQGEVNELKGEVQQLDGAVQLERSRVQQLETEVADGAKNTAGYRNAFEAMLENEKITEGDIINKNRQIAVLEQEITFLEIKLRWGDQRRASSAMAQAGDCALTGECHQHFEIEQWHKSRLGNKFGRSRWKPEIDQTWRDQAAPAGSEWNGEWQIDGTHTAVDQDGWSYGRSEQELNERRANNVSQSEKGPEDVYRTRRWVRAVVLSGSVLPENMSFEQCGMTPRSPDK